MLWPVIAPLALAAAPVELQPGVEYAAGTRVQSSELGLSFEIPTGWKGGLPPGADAMLLASDTLPGLVLVTAEPGVDLAQAKQLLSEPLPVDATTVLRPAGAPTVSGSALSQRYAAPGFVGHARGRVTDRAGILFVALGPIADDARVASLADTLIGSVQEHAAPPPPAAPTGDLAEGLRGREVYYLKVNNGFSDEWHAYLCSDGTAIWSSRSSSMSTGGVGTASLTSRSNDRGRWSVQGASLVIRWDDGTTGSYPLEQSGGEVGVALSNHWVQAQDVCR